MIPGVALGLVLLFALPASGGAVEVVRPPVPGRILAALRGPLGLVFGISALGAFIQRLFLTMMPIIASRSGMSEAGGALLLSAYLGAQAVGTLSSGLLTDRVDRRKLLIAVTALAVPAHIVAFIATPGSAIGVGFAIASGFLNMAILPPVIVMAQEMMPGRAALSSGIVMGLAWAAGSLPIPLAGALADAVGPVAASAWAVPVLLLATLLASHRSLVPYRRPATTHA